MTDFTIAQAQLVSLARRYNLEESQPYARHAAMAGLVHCADTRPDVLTHELATVLYGMQQDFSESRATGCIVAELSDIVSDLDPVTESYRGKSLTYWRNVVVDAQQ